MMMATQKPGSNPSRYGQEIQAAIRLLIMTETKVDASGQITKIQIHILLKRLKRTNKNNNRDSQSMFL